MKKIIITGACGLVGMNLLSLIDKSKYQIIAIDKIEHNIILAQKLSPEVEFIKADIVIDNNWKESFKNANCVIQLQAQISSSQKRAYIKNNIESVRNIISVCERYKIKHLIHLSSSVVISVANDHYTNTKKIGEQLVIGSKVPHTILRPPLMYGCFDVKHLGFLTRILEISPIFPMPGSGKYLRQPLFVQDLCRIIIHLIEIKPKSKIHNIIGKEKINLIDLLKIIAKEKKIHRFYLKIPILIFVLLLKCYSLITRSKPFVPDQLKALTAGDIFPVTGWEEEFGVKYTPFREGIRKMLNSSYYKYRLEMERNKE
ncbi:NAD(P)-dependent oxidoreductase [Candidatus Woesearchaeota archaeon]|nr:NAD(P)-dependent oxidoreductase [Candidatus Woesearchaeota archaeon]